MKLTIPGGLFYLYGEKDLYNSLRERLPYLPTYTEGSYYVPEECAEEVQKMSLQEQAELVYSALYDAHDATRKGYQAQETLLDESSMYYRNAWLELPLAGYEVFGSLAHLLAPWLHVAGFNLAQTFAPGYTAQVQKIEAMDPEHLPLLTGVYLVKRREFVEKHSIADEGDLRDFIGEKANDVFGIIYGTPSCCPAHQNVRQRLANRMYHDRDSRAYAYGVARCAMRANGGGSPMVDW